MFALPGALLGLIGPLHRRCVLPSFNGGEAGLKTHERLAF